MSGVRILDLGTFLAGPYAASIFGEFGAEVLKIEHPIAGDPMRRFGTPTKRHDATLAFLSEARNGKPVAIDLRQKDGVELFLKLVAKFDVLIENFRPGTMEEMGGSAGTSSGRPIRASFSCACPATGRPGLIGAARRLQVSRTPSAACRTLPVFRGSRRSFRARFRSATTCPASMPRSEPCSRFAIAG
jgi:hypothetical protein